MLASKLLVICTLISFLCVTKCLNFKRSEAQMPVPELITHHGYPVEIHNVITEDCYILGIHRIPYSPKKSFMNITKSAVFLQHGIVASSVDWIIPGPGIGLAYLLSDLGYDVWMGNSRGNTYSKRHIVLSANDEEFWNFSFHELGVYDNPAIIDYIVKMTGQSKIFYLAHSQGTTSFFVTCSERPEYNDKIRAMFAFAPIAYMAHMRNPIFQFISEFYQDIEPIMKLLEMHEFPPENRLVSKIGSHLCKPYAITQPICKFMMFLVVGFSDKNLNKTSLPTIIGHVPAGNSIKQLYHYAQTVVSGKFRHYDYGLVDNLIKYNQLSPPDYNLRFITTPVTLFYGTNDLLAGEEDVKMLYNNLLNSYRLFIVPGSNHIDFLWGNNAKEEVYTHLFNLMSYF